jgi:hypothetical protein
MATYFLRNRMKNGLLLLFYICIKKGEFAPSYCVTLAGEMGARFSSSSHRALIFTRYHLHANQKKNQRPKIFALQIDKQCNAYLFLPIEGSRKTNAVKKNTRKLTCSWKGKKERDWGFFILFFWSLSESLIPLLEQVQVVEAVDVNGHLMRRLHGDRPTSVQGSPHGGVSTPARPPTPPPSPRTPCRAATQATSSFSWPLGVRQIFLSQPQWSDGLISGPKYPSSSHRQARSWKNLLELQWGHQPSYHTIYLTYYLKLHYINSVIYHTKQYFTRLYPCSVVDILTLVLWHLRG